MFESLRTIEAPGYGLVVEDISENVPRLPLPQRGRIGAACLRRGSRSGVRGRTWRLSLIEPPLEAPWRIHLAGVGGVAGSGLLAFRSPVCRGSSGVPNNLPKT